MVNKRIYKEVITHLVPAVLKIGPVLFVLAARCKAGKYSKTRKDAGDACPHYMVKSGLEILSVSSGLVHVVFFFSLDSLTIKFVKRQSTADRSLIRRMCN